MVEIRMFHVLNGINIESQSLIKYLGASTDNCLDGDLMALSIIQKANCRLKFLNRNAKFLNRQCHFGYGCTSWFSALSCKLKSKLQTTQNKLVRCVIGKHNHSHVGTSGLKEVNWLPVEHRVAPIKLILVYRTVNCSAPDYLQKDFNHVSQVHKYSTCFSISSLFVPSVKSAGIPTFTCTAVKLWNELPKNICLK